MSTRTQLRVPKKLIDKYGSKLSIWSYSKLNTYHNCKHEYYLNRILKYKSKDNIYSLCGSVAHDILEDYYNKKIEYKDMEKIFQTKYMDVEVGDFKFSSDNNKHLKMAKKYKDCISNFFKTHNVINEKVLCEKEIWIDIGSNIFIGYVDAIHKEKDTYIITDYKTSSISEYKGNKVKEKGKQLLLYALGLNQLGIPIENIKVRWNFLKYVNVSYKLKNGKTRTVNAERNKWVYSIKNNLKNELISYFNYEPWEAEIEINKYIIENSLKGLPKEIVAKYELQDCYVYAEVSEKNIEELVSEMVRDIKLIKEKGEDKEKWEENKIANNDTYYCNVLCGVKKQCMYHKKYLEEIRENFQKDIDIVKELEDLL